MKKILNIVALAAMAALTAVSCREKEPETVPDLPVTYANLDGLWTLELWRGEPLPEGSWCHVEFTRREHAFTIWQNIGSMYTRTLTGTFSIETDDYGVSTIAGEYDWGGGPWGSSYLVKGIGADGRMTWTSTSDSGDVSVYRRIENLPEGVEN